MPLKFVNKDLQERFDAISPVLKAQMRRRFKLAHQLHVLLESKHMLAKDLARLLEKHESEISKWLSGTQNMTSDTVALIEYHLGENSLNIPKDTKSISRATFEKSDNETLSGELTESQIQLMFRRSMTGGESFPVREVHVKSNQMSSAE